MLKSITILFICLIAISCKKDEPVNRQGNFEVYLEGKAYSYTFARKKATGTEFKIFDEKPMLGVSATWDIYANKGDTFHITVTDKSGNYTNTTVHYNGKQLFASKCACEVDEEFYIP